VDGIDPGPLPEWFVAMIVAGVLVAAGFYLWGLRR
jgi:hypothetical protein